MTDVAAAGTEEVDLLGDFEANYGAQLIGCTVTRIIGEISARPSTAPNDINPRLFTGILVEENGGTADNRPTPSTELHADWMYWRAAQALNRDQNPGAEFDQNPQVIQYLDVRAQRKLEELNEGLFLEFEASEAYNIAWGLSVLVKLP